MIYAFFLGFIEFTSNVGRTWDHPYTPRSMTYDIGRDLAHRLTLRRFEN